jgi:hypothetical protein
VSTLEHEALEEERMSGIKIRVDEEALGYLEEKGLI